MIDRGSLFAIGASVIFVEQRHRMRKGKVEMGDTWIVAVVEAQRRYLYECYYDEAERMAEQRYGDGCDL